MHADELYPAVNFVRGAPNWGYQTQYHDALLSNCLTTFSYLIINYSAEHLNSGGVYIYIYILHRHVKLLSVKYEL